MNLTLPTYTPKGQGRVRSNKKNVTPLRAPIIIFAQVAVECVSQSFDELDFHGTVTGNFKNLHVLLLTDPEIEKDDGQHDGIAR